jgi:hypothetical protein
VLLAAEPAVRQVFLLPLFQRLTTVSPGNKHGRFGHCGRRDEQWDDRYPTEAKSSGHGGTRRYHLSALNEMSSDDDLPAQLVTTKTGSAPDDRFSLEKKLQWETP